ncbi:MAG TPA: aminoglycoside phosphotransferase family protein [Stenomitos sp.]
MNHNSPNPIGTPPAEVEIDAALVSTLLQEQHPDFAHLPLAPADTGWDNAMFRLGSRWAVRLPRHQGASIRIEHEQIWLPELASKLPVAVPVPERCGVPSRHYPWRWSILPWLDGMTADQAEPRADQAPRLAAFLRALHVSAPAHAPRNPVRGVPLEQRAAAVEARMQRLETHTHFINARIKHVWQQALTAPQHRNDTWIHGDLHARNVLIQQGAIAGVIDWGDMAAGDRATDLAAIWMLFTDSTARQQAIAAYGELCEATWQRAKGWAILFGVVLLDSGLVDNPRHACMGERTLQRIAEDA